MKHFDLLEQKRKHVKTYKKDIPPKEIVERALYKAWKTSPSKNNAMAYEVVVWGPDKVKEKELIHGLVVKCHADVEDGSCRWSGKNPQGKSNGYENPYYRHKRKSILNYNTADLLNQMYIIRNKLKHPLLINTWKSYRKDNW